MNKKLSRRSFLKGASSALGGVACLGALSAGRVSSAQIAPYLKKSGKVRKVIVIGMDGLDPAMLRRFVGEGHMPNFQKLISTGYFGELQTTMPAQSPVAWASFISGTNPGGHGIFDFIHRDPASFTPHLSISRSFDAKKHISIGNWNIPVDSGRMELMRRGPAFWSLLEREGIPASIFQVPSNFPVLDSETRAVSGMGTPDLLGGYGTCSYYSALDVPGSDHMDGATVRRVRLIDNVIRTKLSGPRNSLRDGSPDTEVDLNISCDPTEPIARIQLQDSTVIVRQGEWSDWVPVSFELMPLVASVPGMVRFFLKEVRPHFKLYVTPVNIDPIDPAFPICSPASYSRELAEEVGRFYTQGLPADTKSLSSGLLSDEDYFSQAKLVLEENFRALHYKLDTFKEGLLYFYFSSIDQNCHMLMRNMDPTHPLYNPKAAPEIKNAVRYLYQRMDEALGAAYAKVDADTQIVVLSDHGFAPFYREFHLNTWLAENGYLALKEPLGEDPGDYFSLVDWSKTKAYGLGFNGLYLNLKDREPHGIVNAEEAQGIKREIIQKLHQVVDPKNGARVVSEAFDSSVIYSGPYMALAPDILVGYQRTYRTSDESVLGKLPNLIVGDRTNKWSADHCFDSRLIPGVILSNRRCTVEKPGIWDIGPSILSFFGVAPDPGMTGKPVFAEA